MVIEDKVSERKNRGGFGNRNYEATTACSVTLSFDATSAWKSAYSETAVAGPSHVPLLPERTQGILTSVPAPAPCRSLALVSDDVDVDVVPRARLNDLAAGDGDVERYSHEEFLLDAGIVTRSPEE